MADILQKFWPVALAAVAFVLLLGLINMMRGGPATRSQMLMRWRVILQFIAIGVVMLTLYLAQTPERLMVVLNRIVTRTGDDGTSALATGERRPKSDVRFAAIGTIDELNAALGVARLDVGDLDPHLARIHNDLFDLGADLATPETARRSEERLRISSAQVARLEAEVAALNQRLPDLKSFVLPGGTRAAAALHVCRTIARRAERTLVELAANEPLNPEALRYVNRLSDFFFVAARHANADGKADVLWVPGQNR